MTYGEDSNLLVFDPEWETAARALARKYSRQGRSNKALRWYSAIVTMLLLVFFWMWLWEVTR